VRRAAILLALPALAACGGHQAPSAASVARAWSAALDRNDNEAAARLFADGAKIVQGGELVLHDHAAAVQWNAMLPCGGAIESVTTQNSTDVFVVFRLNERPQHRCDGPGTRAAALFRVQDGKIVLWHQTQPPPLGRTPGGELA
jgi:limonene-1,2-epoxide hydrolase